MTRKLTHNVRTLILERIVEGRSLRSICGDKDIPITPAAVRKAAAKDEEFGTQYARARDLGLDAMLDEILEIADDSSGDWVQVKNKDGSVEWKFNHENVQRSRLRCDARKWYLSKLAPKKYGDRITQDAQASSDIFKTMSKEQIDYKLSQILDNAKKRFSDSQIN